MLDPSPATAEETCTRHDVTHALYEDRTITVTYGAHERLIVVPSVYKTVRKKRQILPTHCPGTIFREEYWRPPDGGTRLILDPPTFKLDHVTESTRHFVVDKPWQVRRVPSNGYPRRIIRRVMVSKVSCKPDEMVPATEEEFDERIIDTHATARREWVPEQTKTITERVVAKPASVSVRDVLCRDEVEK